MTVLYPAARRKRRYPIPRRHSTSYILIHSFEILNRRVRGTHAMRSWTAPVDRLPGVCRWCETIHFFKIVFARRFILENVILSPSSGLGWRHFGETFCTGEFLLRAPSIFEAWKHRHFGANTWSIIIHRIKRIPESVFITLSLKDVFFYWIRRIAYSIYVYGWLGEWSIAWFTRSQNSAHLTAIK